MSADAALIEQITEDLANLHKDPLGFVMFAFPWGEQNTELANCFGPEPWQQDVLRGLREYSPKKALLEAVSSGHGVGKLHSYDTIVPTPAGMRRWGDLKVGDLVFGVDGKPTRIVACRHHTDVPMYRVSFDDDSYCDVSSGHLWNVRGRRERRLNREGWRTLETIALADEVKRSNGIALARQWEIPVQAPAEFEAREVAVHPYIMGLWLSDGHRGKPRITKPFQEIADKVEALGYDIVWVNPKTFHISDLSRDMRDDPVFDKRSPERYIPDDYKLNSIANRMALLAGLCDGDGEVHRHTGTIGYSTASRRLALDVVWLVRSLGGKAQLQPTAKAAGYRDTDGNFIECLDCYRVTISLTFNPFTIEHRRARFKCSEHRYLVRWIDSIEPIGSADGMCITVAAEDGLYLANDFIVTHNSALVAWIILWAISTCQDTRGVITANTETQLKTKTWSELAKWFRLFIGRQFFRLEASGIFSREPGHEKTWRIDVVPWSERTTEAFAGLHNQGRRILVVFDEACHDEQTEVMTASGWKFFADVTEGDELLTMDPLTRAAEYVEPTHLHASYHNGEMISYRRRGASFLVTPNHRMYVRGQKGYWSMREAGELADCDNVEVFIPRTFTRTAEDLSEVYVPEFTGVRKTWAPVSFAADDFLRLAGWYCSEGNVDYKSGRPVGIRITQRDSREIHALCQRLELSCGVSRVPGRADQVLIYGTHLAQFFAAYGRGAKNKRVPDFVREASSRQINIFLDIFRDGDGYKKADGRDILYTSSKGMADDLQELIHLAGKQSTITTRDLNNKEINFGTHVSRSTGIGYIVSRTEPSDMSLKTCRIERVPYTGMVYCATLPKHGLLFTRRDGVCMWSGNSAIPDAIWETTQGALTDANTEIIWAVFGNPTRNDGRFKQCFPGGQFAHRWRSRTVDSREVSFTDKAQIDRWIADYGEDDDFVRVRVKGVFPRIGNLQFISTELAAEAGRREVEAHAHDPLVVGVDVARFGDDASVFYTRRGRDGRSIAPQIFRGVDTMGLAARLAEHVIANKPDAVFIDGGGVGGGVIDRCRQLGMHVFDIQFGARPDRPDISAEQNKYANKRAEIWGSMRDWLQVGAIPADAELAAQLTTSQYGFNSRDEIQLESKTDLRRRGAGSPDIADALALTFAWPVLPRDLENADRRGRPAQAEIDYDPFAEERAA